MLNFSFFGLFLLFTIYASTTIAMPIDDEVAEKRYAGNLHMGFGKRSTVPFFGLDKRPASGFSQFHMGLGKRANELNDAGIFYLSPDESVESEKRYDMNQFHMGFGKRSISINQFHMGLGKRFDVNFPEKKSFHMGLGKRSIENVE
uniref:Uncharacterized protein n=1 Tax=Panagrolaimus sp. PS1159 TaxID=55785 RepID=A0AC35GBT9_9BILA